MWGVHGLLARLHCGIVILSCLVHCWFSSTLLQHCCDATSNGFQVLASIQMYLNIVPWRSEMVLMMQVVHSTQIYDAQKGGSHHNVSATLGALGPNAESRQPVAIISGLYHSKTQKNTYHIISIHGKANRSKQIYRVSWIAALRLLLRMEDYHVFLLDLDQMLFVACRQQRRASLRIPAE